MSSEIAKRQRSIPVRRSLSFAYCCRAIPPCPDWRSAVRDWKRPFSPSPGTMAKTEIASTDPSFSPHAGFRETEETTMSTTVAALSNTRIEHSINHTATIYLKEAKYEFLKNLRLRVYTVSVITFPLMFYVLFGLVLNAKEAIGGTGVSTYLIATYGTFGVMGASLFGTAAGLASDRGLGWLQVKSASPMTSFVQFS